MKLFQSLGLLVVIATSIVASPSTPSNGWQVTERGQNHRKWNRVVVTTNELGLCQFKTNSITELATGMHRKVNGEWVENHPRIVLTTNGAACLGAEHQAVLGPNLNRRAAIMIRSPLGNWMKGNVLGLAYNDPAQGKTVLIAQIQDCLGTIIGNNQVVYRNAFTDVHADVRYTYTRAGFEQDVILREQPPAAELFGMNSETAQLIVITEFLDQAAPSPISFPPLDDVLAQHGVTGRQGRSAAGQTNSTNTDQVLDFGGLQLSFGKAFEVGNEEVKGAAFGNSVAVQRKWQVQNGRSFLMERVQMKDVRNQMQRLPRNHQAAGRPEPQGSRHRISDTFLLPELLLAEDKQPAMQIAAAETEAHGFVLDYQLVNSGWGMATPGPNGANVLEYAVNFSSGETYLITGQFVILGSTYIYPGAVIKYVSFDYTDYAPEGLDIEGDAYIGGDTRNLVYITSASDASVGDASTADWYLSVYSDPTPRMASYPQALELHPTSNWGNTISGVEVRYAAYGLCFFQNGDQYSPHMIAGCNFVDCGVSISSYGANLYIQGCNFTTSDGTAQWLYPDPNICGNGWTNYLFDTKPFLVNNAQLNSDSLTFNMYATVGFSEGNWGPNVSLSYPTFSFNSNYAAPYYDKNTNGIPDACEVIGTSAAPAIDSDHDGLPDWWEMEYFGTLKFGPNHDPDHDGWTNLQEYQRGTDPNQFDSGGTLTYFTPPSGLVAWWKGDLCLMDAAGTNDLTIVGSTNYVSGMVGQGLCFLQYSNFAKIAASPSLNVGTNGLTVEGWILPNDIFTYSPILEWNSGQVGGSIGVHLWVNPYGTLFSSVTEVSGAAHVIQSPPASITSGIFQHVALTYDKSSGMARLYVNGQTRAESHLGTFTPRTGFGAYIGRRPSDNANYHWWFNGVIDELSVYNRALGSNEIASICAASVAGKSPPPDVNHDGLPDAWEMQYFGDLNHKTNDLDASGSMTLLYDANNSLNPNIINPVQLGFWHFDDTTTWTNATGQLPLQATCLAGVLSWSTNALLINSNNPAVLCYPAFKTNGMAELGLWNGTVRFWFRPDWSSSSAGGSGPGTSGRLLEVGTYSAAYTNGGWALYVSPDGNSINFGTATNGAGGINLSAGISWISNQWHQLVLTYNSTNSQMYLDGQLTAVGTGVTNYPSPMERAQGFRIGSDTAGANQAKGAFDELETYNYNLVQYDIALNYQTAIQWDSAGSGLPNIWQMNNFGSLGVVLPNDSASCDGLSNLEKYQMGLPVQTAASVIHIFQPFAPANTVTPAGAAVMLLDSSRRIVIQSVPNLPQP